MGGFLIFLSFALFIASVVGLFRPVKFLGMTTGWRAVGGLVVSFMIFAAGGALLPEPAPTQATSKAAGKVVAPPAEPSVRASDQSIQSATVEGDTLVVEVKFSTAWNDQQYVDFAGLTIQSVGRAMQAGAPEGADATKVRFVFFVPATDRLGKETTGGLAAMVFSAQDLREARFDNLSTDRVLNLATMVVPGGLGRQAISKWCSEDAHADGATFCSLALG